MKIKNTNSGLFTGELRNCQKVQAAISKVKFNPVFLAVGEILTGARPTRVIEVSAEFTHNGDVWDRWAPGTGTIDVWCTVLMATATGFITIEGRLSEIMSLFRCGPIFTDHAVSAKKYICAAV